MVQRGSSRIISIITVVEGGTGPQGLTGATGNTGNYVTGPTGPMGLGITGFTYNSSIDGLTFYIEGSTAVYLTGFRGITGNAETVAAPTFSSIGLGVSFVGSSGYTLFFRSITFSSGISASVSGDYIFIQENVGDTGSFGPDRLIFVNFSSPTYYLESSDFAKYKETVYSSNTYGNFEITQRTGRDLFGVENFNYSTGSAQNSAHYGLTMTIDSAFYGVSGTDVDIKLGAWNPYLKYRVNYYDLNGLSGATFGVVDFSPLGPYTKQIKFGVELGSCCYCDDCRGSDINGRKCEDYVLKEYCELVDGRWSKSTCYERQNGFDCYRRRACCVNGTCVNTSFEKCTQMGGTFCAGKECGLDYDCSQQCIQTASVVVSSCCCCKNGVGTPTVCDQPCEEGAIQFLQPCTSVNCCTADNFGACCESNGTCNQKTPQDCAAVNGIFRGAGTTCNPNPCCDPI